MAVDESVGLLVRRCAKIEKFVWRISWPADGGTLCQFSSRLSFLEETPRPDERKSNVITKWGPEQEGVRGRRGVYYLRDDGVKRGIIVNIFAASALSFKTMAVVQLSRFEPTLALR